MSFTSVPQQVAELLVITISEEDLTITFDNKVLGTGGISWEDGNADWTDGGVEVGYGMRACDPDILTEVDHRLSEMIAYLNANHRGEALDNLTIKFTNPSGVVVLKTSDL